MQTRTILVFSAFVVLGGTLFVFGGRFEEDQLRKLNDKQSTVELHLEYLKQKLGPEHDTTRRAQDILSDIENKVFQMNLDVLKQTDPAQMDDADLREAVVVLAQHVAVLQRRIQSLENAQHVRIMPVELQ